MKSTPFRLTVGLLLSLTLIFLIFDGQAKQIVVRIHLISTLLSTFILFPLSNIQTVQLDENLMKIRNENVQGEQQRIPKVIHQVKLGNLEMRSSWTKARESCAKFHPEWEMKLWQDEESNDFVQKEFPDLYSTYIGYPLEIQRSNVLRYLILQRHGGVYLDLDLRCKTSLNGLLNETFITPPANPSGINNAFIASVPHHPFWQFVEKNLIMFNKNWFSSPYITNMFSTGCHFLSTMHRLFPDQKSLRILDKQNKLNGHVQTPIFEHLGASSWHKGDAKAILMLGKQIENGKKHPLLFTLAIMLFIASLISLFFAIHLCCKAQRTNKKGYQDIEASKITVSHHNE